MGDKAMCCNFGINPEKFNPNIWFAFTHRIAGQKTHKEHVHDCVEFIYMLSGNVRYRIKNKIYKLEKGDLLIMNPGILHERIQLKNSTGAIMHIGIHGINIKGMPPNKFWKDTDIKILKLKENTIEFENCCSDFIKTQEKDEPGASLIIKSIVMKMIVLSLKSINSNYDRSKPRVSFKTAERTNAINIISEYMENNYMEDISLDRIARSIYISSAYVSKLFKEEFGDSPINHLIKIRLTKAIELLEKSDMSISEVSKQVGYKDSYYFSRLFKKYYNMTASEYRKLNKK
jgi:AraC-like DNA-binding protein